MEMTIIYNDWLISFNDHCVIAKRSYDNVWFKTSFIDIDVIKEFIDELDKEV